MPRTLKWIALGAFMIFAVLAAALWWAASSSTALQWLAAEAMKQSHGALTLEGVSGSLLGRVQVRKLVYATPDMRVTLEDAAFEISSVALRAGRFELTELDAALVDVYTAPSDKAPELPHTLALPFDLTVARAKFAEIHFNHQTFEGVEFSYAGGKGSHALRDLTADTAYGRLAAQLQIGAQTPFELSGHARLDAPKACNAQVSLAGDLAVTKIKAAGEMRGATLQVDADIAAFEKIWLRHMQARGENIDIAAFKKGLPSTMLQVRIAGEGKANDMAAGTVVIENARPGTVSTNRVPITRLSADYALDDARTIRLSAIAATVSDHGGTFNGSARVKADGTDLDLAIRGLSLHALHAPLYATRLDGKLRGRFTGEMQSVQADVSQRGIRLEFDGARRGDAVTIRQFRAHAGSGVMQGSGDVNLAGLRRYNAAATFERVNPAAFGEYPPASINGRITVDGTLAPSWRANVSMTLNDSMFRGVRFAGNANGEVTADTAHNIKVDVTAGANSIHARGGYGLPAETLAFTLDAKRLSQLDARIGGEFNARGTIGGAAGRPLVDVNVAGKNLAWEKNVRIAALSASAKGTLARHSATLAMRGPDFDINARAEGGWQTGRGWAGLLDSFENAGTYPVHLMAPMRVEYGNRRIVAGPAQLTIAGGRANLESLVWHDDRLDTRGNLTGVPAALLLGMAGAPAPRTTLLVGGSWSIAASPALNGTLTLTREAGDIVTPGDTALALGLETLRTDVRFVNDAVNATLEVAAKTVNGHAQARVSSLAPDAAVTADGRFDIASLEVFNALVGTRALLRGNAELNLKAAGTVAAIRVTGNLAASDLGVLAPQYGVRFRDGVLRAELSEKTLTVSEFSMLGDQGRLTATGSMDRSGGEARVAWHAEHLSVLNRPDMRLKIDGSGSAALAKKKLVLRGTLTADEGRLTFDKPSVSRLDNDIVIVGTPRPTSQGDLRSELQSDLLDVDVLLDAGSKLYVSGAGINTYLGGKLNLKTSQRGVLEARGVLSSVRGIYNAFGQRLEIDRGRLIFDGPIDNPGLDIAARRKNLAVEAGVEVTGTVRVPNIQLTSTPPVSDGEKLAWLTLGHGLDSASGADLSLLQAAASALVLNNNSVSITQRIAKKIGLDELSLKGGGQVGSQVAAFGKRISDKAYLEYQQGMAATSAALRLSYALSQSLSLRLNAGVTSGIGLFFTRSYK